MSAPPMVALAVSVGLTRFWCAKAIVMATDDTIITDKVCFSFMIIGLALPKKFGRTVDFRWKTFVHRTIKAGSLEDFALGRIRREGNMHFRRKTDDAAWRILGHLFFDRDFHAP